MAVKLLVPPCLSWSARRPSGLDGREHDLPVMLRTRDRDVQHLAGAPVYRRYLCKGRAIEQGPRFALHDGNIVPPIIDHPALAAMRAGKDPAMLADAPPLPSATMATGWETRKITGRLAKDAGMLCQLRSISTTQRRNSLGVFDEVVEGRGLAMRCRIAMNPTPGPPYPPASTFRS